MVLSVSIHVTLHFNFDGIENDHELKFAQVSRQIIQSNVRPFSFQLTLSSQIGFSRVIQPCQEFHRIKADDEYN